MMKKFFQRLFKKTDEKSSPRPVEMQQQPMQRQNMPVQLLDMVQQTEEVEYSCDDVYRLMDEYVEMVKRGEDPARLMPLVEQHLKMCDDCREEVEALLRMMNSDAPQ